MNQYLQLHGYNVISYLDLDMDKSIEVLNARNHEMIRILMYNQELISLEDHLKFIKSLYNGEKFYYAVYKNNSYIGSINMSLKETAPSEWGLYLNPIYLETGIGAVLEFIALDLFLLLFNNYELTGLVKEINLSAISNHRRFGFKSIERSNGYIRMNITRENWRNSRKLLLKIFKYEH